MSTTRPERVTYTITITDRSSNEIESVYTNVFDAWQAYKSRRDDVLNGVISVVRVEPMIPVLEDENDERPNQLYVRQSRDNKRFVVTSPGWMTKATVNDFGGSHVAVSVFDFNAIDGVEPRLVANVKGTVQFAIKFAVTALQRYALIDGVDLSDTVIYHEDVLYLTREN